MNDPKFNLVQPEQSSKTTTSARTTGHFWQKVTIGAGGALLLVASALYAPAAWKTLPAMARETAMTTAAPRSASNAATSLKLDASLVKDQEALAGLYTQLAPSVVSIQVKLDASAQGAGMPELPPDYKLPPGFELPQGEVPQAMAEGSGFIFDNDGHIVTNNHVVEGAKDIVVTFNNGYWAQAEVVAADPQADLAVIKVTPPEGMEWKAVNLAEPESLSVGHMVIAMGNPFQLENSMTTGIVSALGRSFSTGVAGRYSLPGVVQTDAAINPGNSGGPLFDLDGNVVGVNFAIESPVRSNSGVGFAIPVSVVRKIVPALIEKGKFDYPYLGIQGGSITPDLARQLELSNIQLGAYVTAVVEDGPAAKAGIEGGNADQEPSPTNMGDIITAINDQKITAFDQLINYLVTKTEPGQEVTLHVIRDGKEQEIKVILGTRPGETQPSRRSAEGGNQQPGRVSPRKAIEIAKEAAQDQLKGDVTQVTTVPDEVDGKSVWVVELSTDSQTATITIDRETGEVIDAKVE